MNFEAFFLQQLGELRREGRYRIFTELERQVGRFPRAKHHRREGVSEVGRLVLQRLPRHESRSTDAGGNA
jgi:hypothetical protein